ncbi:Hypothetical predicted protein [Octopus vulgaris]|uniref:Uncharacterized protein n=1 Tax=Octopus vulgaris TaxID=6645 RepID=A0AA36BIA8_OCTVU|nr:Hypothetical predicted protein [Octopus vulgaris]
MLNIRKMNDADAAAAVAAALTRSGSVSHNTSNNSNYYYNNNNNNEKKKEDNGEADGEDETNEDMVAMKSKEKRKIKKRTINSHLNKQIAHTLQTYYIGISAAVTLVTVGVVVGVVGLSVVAFVVVVGSGCGGCGGGGCGSGGVVVTVIVSVQHFIEVCQRPRGADKHIANERRESGSSSACFMALNDGPADWSDEKQRNKQTSK